MNTDNLKRHDSVRKSLRLTIVASMLVLVSGCNDIWIKKEGAASIQHNPSTEEKLAQLQEQQSAINALLADADSAFAKADYVLAEKHYKSILTQEPNHLRAKDGLRRTALFSQHAAKIEQAYVLVDNNELDQAAALLRTVLVENPANEQATQIYQQLHDNIEADRIANMRTKLAYTTPVSLEFRDTQLKIIIEALAKGTGVNFTLDKDVKKNQRASLFVRNVTLESAIDMLVESNQLRKKVIDDNTVLIYPDTARKASQYQDLVIRSFYLQYAEPATISNLLKNMLGIKQIQTDDRVPMVMVKDVPEVMRLAEKLIKSQDVPVPEVMLDIQIMEIRRTVSETLGLNWPTQLTVIPPGDTLTYRALKDLTSGDIGVSPNPNAIFDGQDVGVNLLSNPRIRVKNKDKAQIHIGDRVPVITSNVSSNGVISDSVQYIDAGLKLDVEPNVSMSGDVNIKLKLDVSSIGESITTQSGAVVPQLGTRSTTTQLRLKDGETQILAGLISDEERQTIDKIPGLGDLPGIGRLFSSQKDENVKTELVMLITPHIIRSAKSPEADLSEYWAGANLNAGRPFSTPSRSKEEISKLFKAGVAPNRNTTAPQPSESVAPESLNIPLPAELTSDFDFGDF